MTKTIARILHVLLIFQGVLLSKPLVEYDNLPGGYINQIEHAGEYLFASVGRGIYDRSEEAGHYLYRSRIDSLDWELIRVSTSAQNPRASPPIQAFGNVGNRLFFNIDSNQAGYTEDWGNSWTPIENMPFVSRVIQVGETLYAGFSDGYHSSVDSGTSWQLIGSEGTFNKVIYHAGYFYGLGEWSLCYYSADTGKSWVAATEGWPDNSVGVTGPAAGQDIVVFEDNIIVATREGLYSIPAGDPTTKTWQLIPNTDSYIQQLKVFDNALYSFTPTSVWRNLTFAGPWEPFIAHHDLSRAGVRFGYHSSVIPFQGKWIIGLDEGVAHFDPINVTATWKDENILQNSAYSYSIIDDKIVGVNRKILYAIEAGKHPQIIRDFTPSTPSNFSIYQYDTHAWIRYSDTLFQYFLHDLPNYTVNAIPISLVSTPWLFGPNFAIGDYIMNIGDAYVDGKAALVLYFSTNAGASFKTDTLDLPEGFSTNRIVQRYIRHDTLWLWESSGNYLTYDLNSGDVQFTQTDIIIGTNSLVSALTLSRGLFIFGENRIFFSEDGGLNWTLANSGAPTTGGYINVQELGNIAFFQNGFNLYYSDWSIPEWQVMSLESLISENETISNLVVTPNGLAFKILNRGTFFQPWEAPDFIKPPLSPKKNRPGLKPISTSMPQFEFHRGKIHVIINGKKYDWTGQGVSR